MADHDELLARADKHRERTTGIGKGFCVVCRGEWPCETVDLAAALRAALAPRAEPLFEGRANELRYSGGVPWTPFDINQRVVIYAAAAGSATPTEDTDGN